MKTLILESINKALGKIDINEPEIILMINLKNEERTKPNHVIFFKINRNPQDPESISITISDYMNAGIMQVNGRDEEYASHKDIKKLKFELGTTKKTLYDLVFDLWATHYYTQVFDHGHISYLQSKT
jgi:hypothetical protein